MDRPTLPSAQEIYDSLMKDIEPELLTANIASLKEKYAGESDAERKQRMQRYQRAYKAYDKAYVAYIQNLKTSVNGYRKDALRSVEKRSQARDADLLLRLEQSFS